MTFFSYDNVLEMPRRPDAWGRRFVGFERSTGEGFHGEIEKLRETHKASGRQTAALYRRRGGEGQEG
jgi:hypothetical protein